MCACLLPFGGLWTHTCSFYSWIAPCYFETSLGCGGFMRLTTALWAVWLCATLIKTHAPAAQLSQLEAPMPEYFPLSHEVQAAEPAGENVPLTHAAHVLEPATE